MNSDEKTALPAVVKLQVVLAVLATVVTIALAAYIPQLVQRKAALDSQIADLTTKKDALEKQMQDLQDQVNATKKAYNSLADTASASLPPEQAQRAIEQSLNSNPAAARILPRVFIHIRSAAQRKKAAQIANLLREQGYIVPGVQIVVQEGPDETQVRYFHPADQDEAGTIARTLTGAGIAKVETDGVSGYANIRARQYEIWFSLDSL